MHPIVLPALLAVFVGVGLGLLGGGGSILTVPILVYAAGMPAHTAIATSLFVVGTTSLAALVPHARAGRVRYKTGALFGAASMVGAFGAGRLAKLVPPAFLLLGFAVMMAITAGAMLRSPRAEAPEEGSGRRQAWWTIAAEGAIVGAVTGLVGAGGGFLVVPALVLLGGLSMRDAVGTSLMVIAMKSFAGFAGYATAVTIDWPVAVAVTAAAVAGSFGGAALAGRISPRRLRTVFAWFVVVMAVLILGRELPATLGLAAGSRGFWLVEGAIGLAAAAATAAALRARARARRRTREACAGGASLAEEGARGAY